jgi:hypothetical protein
MVVYSDYSGLTEDAQIEAGWGSCRKAIKLGVDQPPFIGDRFRAWLCTKEGA